MDSVYKSFAHYEQPLNDFERARQQISTPFDYFDLDLSTARTNQIFNISGDFIYIDMASTGYATLELNNQHDSPKAPFLVRKGFALGATFKQLKISNNAQAGGFLRIMFSTGDRVIPALGDVNISGSVNTIDDGFSYGASFKSNTVLGAGGVETVFAPGANLNGAVIYSAMINSNNTGYQISLIGKNGTPGSVIDGDVYLVGKTMNATAHLNADLVRPVKVPAGRGLYFTTTSAENAGGSMRMVLYTLL